MNHLSFPSCQIGDFQLTALSDGNMSASLTLLSGIKTADAEIIQHHAGITEPSNIHINCYLIRGRERIILVDAGTGGLNNVGGAAQRQPRSGRNQSQRRRHSLIDTLPS